MKDFFTKAVNATTMQHLELLSVFKSVILSITFLIKNLPTVIQIAFLIIVLTSESEKVNFKVHKL